MKPDAKIFVAGHGGLVGSAIVLELQKKGYSNILTRSHKEFDLTNQSAVAAFFLNQKPDYVFLAAARVGGILANASQPAEFIYQNLMIEANIIHHAYLAGVKKLLFLGSSCIYPKFAKQPISESELMTGVLEPTNQAYAVAKITGIKMCAAYNQQFQTNFLCVMPTNLYGPRDNFDLKNSHVLPALMRKIHDAKLKREKTVTIWGTGQPLREFLYGDDLAEACVYLIEKCDAKDVGEILNIGMGKDISIKQLAEMIGEVVGYRGEFIFDASKPDGTPRKVLDVSRLNALGWKAKTSLRDGIQKTYDWYLAQQK